MSASLRRLFFFGLILVFALPYFFTLFVSHFRLHLPDDFPQLLVASLLQATTSAVLAIAVGLAGAMALLKRSARWEVLALMPAAVPSIAIVLGFLSLFPNWRGWLAVASAHALVSSGLVAVVLSRVIRNSLGASLELAWTEGAAKWTLWSQGVLPAIHRDLTRLAVTVFAASLASFSIPLLLSGSKAVSFEIAILHSIRLDASWETAAALSLFQWAMLLGTVLVLGRSEDPHASSIESVSRAPLGRMLGSNAAAVVILAAPVLILVSLLQAPVRGYRQLQSVGLFDSLEFVDTALRGSFVTATFAGIFAAVLLAMFAFLIPTRQQRTWISGYIAPSTAITGFATLVIGWGSDSSFALDAIRISVGSALLFSPILWRLRWEQRLARLEGQIAVAQTLGAPHGMIVGKILMPQLRELFFWSAGLVSFWVWGDYAIGSIAASRAMTVGLVAKSLLESYRLEAASVLILVCLLLGGISYRVFTFGGSRDAS